MSPSNPDGPARATRRTVHLMSQSMSNFLEPWRAQWKQAAAWAKDPFRPAKFENWLEDRSRAAIRKAKEAAEKGKEGVARRWRLIARALKSPVITAVGEIKTSIAEVIRAMLIIDGVKKRLGSYSRNGSTGKNPNVQIGPTGGVEARAAGGPVRAGGTYLVGERGPELLTMGGNGHVTPNHAMGGGNAYTINVHVAPGGDLVQTGRQIVEAIRQYERRSGAVWRS